MSAGRSAAETDPTVDGDAASVPSSSGVVSGRDQLDEIMADMNAAYAAIRDAGYPPYDSPEHEALEAVYVRLRAWNAARV